MLPFPENTSANHVPIDCLGTGLQAQTATLPSADCNIKMENLRASAAFFSLTRPPPRSNLSGRCRRKPRNSGQIPLGSPGAF
jgi:hypothetical protein